MMTLIRPATHEDVPILTDFGRLLHEESPRFVRCRYAPEKVSALMTALIDSDDGLVLVAVEEGGAIFGGIAAAIAEQWYSYDKVAGDISLFIHPDLRGGRIAIRLLAAYREWAESRNATYILAGISTGIHAGNTEKLYKMSGAKYFGPLMEWPVGERHGS